MADLTGTMRWLQYPPDLFGNRSLERPFYFDVAASLSKEQMRVLKAALTAPAAALEPLPVDATEEQRDARDETIRAEVVGRYAVAMEPFVKLGNEPLVIDGKRLGTLREYFDLVTTKVAGTGAFFEVSSALFDANTLSTDQLFRFGRPSGGFTSTTGPNSGRGGSGPAAR